MTLFEPFPDSPASSPPPPLYGEPEPNPREESRAPHPAGPVHLYVERVYAKDGGRSLPVHRTACGLSGLPYTGAGSSGLRTACAPVWADCGDCLEVGARHRA